MLQGGIHHPQLPLLSSKDLECPQKEIFLWNEKSDEEEDG